MADEGRQPVAIRIARPYPSEEAFLEHELDTLTRTSVVLLGAQSRPQGVVLRFEVTLASGAPLLRGEGRVVGYKPNAYNDEPGLTLRFTRLDPRSKALIDRAAALRDARARGVVRPEPPAHEAALEVTHAGPPPSMPRPASVPPPMSSAPTAPPQGRAPPSKRPGSRRPGSMPPSMPPLPGPSPAHDPIPVFADEAPSTTTAYDRDMIDRLRSERLEREVADMPPPTNIGAALLSPEAFTHISEPPVAVVGPRSAPPRRSATPPPPSVIPSGPLVKSSSPRRAVSGPVSPPPDRNELLERLRARGRDMAPVRVRAILDAKAG